MRILPLAAPVAALAFLSLAACGKSAPEAVKLENASVEQVAEATKAVESSFNPGQWRQKTEIISAEIPGLPKEVAEQMSKAMGELSSIEYCMTPEEAKNPRDAFARDNGDCVFEKFDMAGGKVSAAMKCTAKDRPGQMTMTMNGTYGATAFDTTAEMQVTGSAQDMTMKVKQSGQRIGDCKA